MSEERIPIGEFRAKTAEILRAVRETKAAYVITNHGEPVAEVVPYGTPIRKKGKPILGIFEDAGYVPPWEDEGIPYQEWEDREREKRIAEQEAHYQRRTKLMPWLHEDSEPGG
jgi:prevent-host-death family protein